MHNKIIPSDKSSFSTFLSHTCVLFGRLVCLCCVSFTSNEIKQTQTPDCWANWMGKMYFSAVVVESLSSSPFVLRCRPSRPVRLFFRSRWSHSLFTLTPTQREPVCAFVFVYIYVLNIYIVILIIRNSIIYMCYVAHFANFIHIFFRYHYSTRVDIFSLPFILFRTLQVDANCFSVCAMKMKMETNKTE